MIRNVKIADAKAICDIYNYYVINAIISFEEKSVSEAEMAERIQSRGEKPWIVCEENNRILGYAYTRNWRSRHAYRYAVESGVYLTPNETGKGLGTVLYRELLDRFKKIGIHVVIGGIALPNPASVALHEKFGFEKVAHFKEVGFKFNKWIDVGYWELVLK